MIEPGIGTVAGSGHLETHPTATTVYKITATGLGMTATAEVRVLVGGTAGYFHGDPTSAEQAHLKAGNRARRNPLAEAARLEIDLNEGLSPGEISAAPVQPLTSNALLINAARAFTQLMITDKFQDHWHPDDANHENGPDERIAVEGYDILTFGENLGPVLFNGPDTLDGTESEVIHGGLFIDAGGAPIGDNAKAFSTAHTWKSAWAKWRARIMRISKTVMWQRSISHRPRHIPDRS